MTSLDANKDLVRRFLQALYEFHLDDVLELMHPACEFLVPNVTMRPETYDGKAMIEFLKRVRLVIPGGFRFDILEMTAEDDRVSSRVNGYATTVDGTEYNNRYHFLHTVKDGRVIGHVEYIDSYYAAKVLGPIMLRLTGESR